jgi:type I restriction enzyme S subunit
MPKWRDTTLGEVIELKRGYDLPQKDRAPGNVPLVSSSGITDRHSVAIAKGPGVVTGRYGTLGQVFYIREDFWPLNTTLYVRDFKGNDPKFISYFLRSLDFQAYSDKAAVPGLNRNHLHQAQVRLPVDVTHQRAIAGVLGALDDKIEQNRRTARALERLARAIFRAWFVDFEAVKAKSAGATGFPSMPQPVFDTLPTRFVDSANGPVPEGWEVKPIAAIATFLNGLALQKYPPRGDGEDLRVIKIAELRKGSAEGADWASSDVPEQYVINDGDLLFSWSGTLEAKFWFGGKGALNQHLFKVHSSYFPSWFCFLWIRQHLPWFRAIAASKATTMGHIKRGHLQEARVVVPPNQVLREADEVIGSIYDLYAYIMIESRNLAEMRDYLLPRLLSGEVRVREAERAAGAAV